MSLSDSIATLIERLGRLQRAADHTHDLNPAQWEVLRYLGRCNRFSNTATAVTAYLGSTKGTVSQTLNALERKGLIARTKDRVSARIIRLSVTDKGLSVLADDPMLGLRTVIESIPGYRSRPVEEGLTQILQKLVADTQGEQFGTCAGCVHAQRTRYGTPEPVYCDFFQTLIPEEETKRLCVAFDPK